MVVHLLLCITLRATVVDSIYHKSMTVLRPASTLDDNALFGYSVAFNGKMLFVSSPNTTTAGNIYQCKYTESSPCTEIKIDIERKDSLTNMWLGATVAAGNDFVVACAPRFIEKKEKTGTFGKCYSSHVSKIDFQEMFYLNDSDKEPYQRKYERYMDSLGWSINVDLQDNVMIGGPAMYTGRVACYNPFTKRITHVLNGERSNIKFNFGYSVTSGLFVNTTQIHQAISSPYGSMGYGKVVLSDGVKSQKLQDPTEYKPPVGSLYGASLCAAKLRGPDQREALLIGAPLYAQTNEIDVGAVYVYLFHLEKGYVVHQKTILGFAHRGQFGSAIISLGDLNGDKRDEVAISAPYEDNDRGAVYIYSAADILRDITPTMLKPIQKIHLKPFSVLGFSLAAFKANGTGDLLAIGAPGSNKVLLYRSIPKIVITVKYLEENKTPKYPQARRNETYYVFNSCVDVKYPERPDRVKADIQVKVGLTHPTAKIANALEESSLTYLISVAKFKRATYCQQVAIIIPLEGGYEPNVQYYVSATQLNGPSSQRYYEGSHAQISDLSVTSITDTVWVADCAGYKKCEPKLTFDVFTTLKDGYVIGSSDVESLHVVVNNTGDVAYSACVSVRMLGVQLRSRPAGCTIDNNALYCSPQQPIRNNSQWDSGEIELEMKSLTSVAKQITFAVQKFSNCKDKTQQEIDDEKNIAIKLDTDRKGLILLGSTNLGDELYLTRNELDVTGKQMSHNYIIFNGGVTEWVNISCEIVVEKKDYYKNITVTIDTRESYDCEEVTLKDQRLTTKCTINKLRSQHKFDAILSINIEPGTLSFDEEDHQNATISSYVTVSFGENKLQGSVTSLLKKSQASVPLWVIIAAALVGLLIMILIVLALHECGFLRRKNKEKLKNLRRSVYRQSIRRSTALRESVRASVRVEPNKIPEDEEKLLNEDTLREQPPKVTVPRAKDSVGVENSGSTDVSSAASACTSSAKGDSNNKDEGVVNRAPSKGECDVTNPDKMRKELIILGLQKNIGARQRPIVPPKPPRNSIDITETDKL